MSRKKEERLEKKSARRDARVKRPVRRERKDRVLQTRVPQSLYDELVAQAGKLRVPVSNLVRNILEDSARMVGNIVDGGLQIAAALGDRADKSELAEVVGWQPLTANKHLVCAHCGAAIAKGEQAFIGLGAPGGRSLIVCAACEGKGAP
ncbi:MAG TPA: hypothetical protein PK961_07920 [bacterium]|nr:hypothetical protein [bacterium]